MNRLDLTAEGGVAIFLDDFMFLQAAYKEALEAIVKGLGSGYDDFILSGLVQTLDAGVATLTAGFVVVNGEILKFDGQAISYTQGDQIYIEAEETATAQSARDIVDGGGTVNVQFSRKAKLMLAADIASVPAGLPYWEPGLSDMPKTLYDIIQQTLAAM